MQIYKIVSLLALILVFSGCFNILREKNSHNEDTTYIEAIKAITARIDIFSSKTKIKADGLDTAEIRTDIYDKYGVIYNTTERDYYINNEKIFNGSSVTLNFKTTVAGIYVIFTKKGDVTSSAVTITAE